MQHSVFRFAPLSWKVHVVGDSIEAEGRIRRIITSWIAISRKQSLPLRPTRVLAMLSTKFEHKKMLCTTISTLIFVIKSVWEYDRCHVVL